MGPALLSLALLLLAAASVAMTPVTRLSSTTVPLVEPEGTTWQGTNEDELGTAAGGLGTTRSPTEEEPMGGEQVLPTHVEQRAIGELGATDTELYKAIERLRLQMNTMAGDQSRKLLEDEMTITALKTSNGALQQKVNAIEENNRGMEEQLMEQQKIVTDLKTADAGQEERVNALEARGEILRKQLDEHQMFITGLKTSIWVLQQKMNETEEEDKGLGKRHAQMTEVVAELKASVILMQKQLKAVRGALLSEELLETAKGGCTVKLRQLIGQGAQVTYRNEDGVTALHKAAIHGHMGALKVLLNSGAQVDATADTGTPLHWAAWNGHEQIVEALAAAGADIHARDIDGGTPLHDAAFRNQAETVRALLELGADASVRNNEGQTARDVASSDAVRALLPPITKKRTRYG